MRIRDWVAATLAGLTLAGTGAELRAQSAPISVVPVSVGDTVRVWAPAMDLKGRRTTVVPWAPSLARFVTLAQPFDSVEIPFGHLTRLEVLDGKATGRGLMRGLAIGGALGGLLGVVVGKAAVSGCQEFLCELDAIGYMGGGLIAGALVGGAIGVANPPDRWRRVGLPTHEGFPPYQAPWHESTGFRVLSAVLGLVVTIASK